MCDTTICAMWLIHRCEMSLKGERLVSSLNLASLCPLSHVLFSGLSLSWLIHTCEMSLKGGPFQKRHSYFERLLRRCDSCAWDDLFTCVTWPVQLFFTRVTWVVDIYDLTHSHVWQDPRSVIRLSDYMCDVTNSHVWHVMLTCVTWLIKMCDMTHLYVWHDSFMCATRLIHTYVSHSMCHTVCVTQGTDCQHWL